MSKENAFVRIGMSQLNAALYFLARFSVFEQYYWPFDIVWSAIYTIRVTYFFLAYTDATKENRVNYRDIHKQTAYYLAGIFVVYFSIQTFEWGHIPVLETLGWSTVFILNYVNFNTLNDYAAELSLRASHHSVKEPRYSQIE